MMYCRTKQKRGFTLIELLVVVAIIAFLASIVGVVVMNSIVGARIAATKSTLIKTQRQLQQRIEALIRSDVYRTQRDFQGGVFLEVAAVDTAARRGGSTPAQRVNHVKSALGKKVLQRQFLPQTWAEAGYLLRRAGKTAPASIDPLLESAEVLYFFLSDSSIIGYTPGGQDVFGGNETRDTDGNGFPELVDGWGRALRFYRWPTRLVRPNGYSFTGVASADYERAKTLISGIPTTIQLPPPGAGVAADNVTSFLNQDPDDSLNFLSPGNGWLANAAEAANVEAGTGSFSGTPFPLHTLFTWHTPLVVSAGPDGEFGIYDPTAAGHFGRLCEPDLTTSINDNITTLNFK